MRRARIAVAIAMAVGLTFGLAGTAQAAVTVEPDTLDFGQVVVGATSETLSVTFTNTGTEDVLFDGQFGPGVESGDFDGQPGGFEAFGSCFNPAIGLVVPAGGECNVDFIFQPTAEGLRSATLIWEEEEGGADIGSTDLIGEGVSPCAAPNGPLSGPAHGLLGPLGLGDVSKLLCDLGL